jgi:hypothetical protein
MVGCAFYISQGLPGYHIIVIINNSLTSLPVTFGTTGFGNIGRRDF